MNPHGFESSHPSSVVIIAWIVHFTTALLQAFPWEFKPLSYRSSPMGLCHICRKIISSLIRLRPLHTVE
jgi:hypothetical protein